MFLAKVQIQTNFILIFEVGFLSICILS